MQQSDTEHTDLQTLVGEASFMPDAHLKPLHVLACLLQEGPVHPGAHKKWLAPLPPPVPTFFAVYSHCLGIYF